MKILIDENIQSEVRGVNYVDVGIHDDMELTDIKVDKSPKGNNYMVFTFLAPNGKILTKTEWQPNGQEDDVLLKKIQNQAKRIKHIMTKFMAEEHTKIEYDSEQWVKYASTVKAKLDAVKAGVKLRLKALYDYQNYVTLPNYLPFVERMDTPKTNLEILSIDKVKKDEADKETFSPSPFDTPPITTQEVINNALTVATPPLNNDLPF